MPPAIHEETALLGGQRTNETPENDALLHPHASEVIERTSVLFQPSFRRNKESDTNITSDFASEIDGGDRSSLNSGSSSSSRSQNSIALSSNVGRLFGSRRSFGSRSSSILEASGIAGSNISSSTTNTRAMIGTISTTSILNLVVATAGGIGMVTLPGSFAAVGWLAGTLLLLMSGAAAAGSLFLLDWACDAVNAQGRQNGSSGKGSIQAIPSEDTASYAGLVAHTLGKPGSQTLEVLTLAYCVGQLVAYLGAIGGQVLSLLSLVGIDESSMGMSIDIHDCIWVVALGVIFPLSLLPEESSMRFAGFLGTICMIYIASTVVFGDGIGALRRGGLCSLSDSGNDNDYDVSSNETNSPLAFASGWIILLQNAPIFLFSMNASVTFVPVRYQHQTCLGHLLSSVSNGSKLSKEAAAIPHTESTTIISTSIVVAAGFYLVCSGVAYASYCDSVPENVVDAWPLSWIPGSLARLFLSVELVAAGAGIYVPLGRAALWHLIYGPYESVGGGTVRALLTFALIAGGAVGSVLLGGALALPLAITSALCVTAQMFVLPGLCAAALLEGSEHEHDSESNSDSNSNDNRNRNSNRSRIPGGRFTTLAFAAMGGLLGALSLAALLGLLG